MDDMDFRLKKFLSLDEEEKRDIEEVVNLCSPNLTNVPFGERLSVACDFCDREQDVLRLWSSEICDSPPNYGFDVTIYVMYLLILIIAITGNSIVVYVVGSSIKMRTVTNYFIANLAVGDLCMAIFCLPFSFLSTLILKYWPFGSHLCVTVNYLQAVSVFVSAFTLVAISLDRYLAIIYPLRPRMTRFQAKVIISGVWAFSLLTTLPIVIYSKLMMPGVNFYRYFGREVCTEDWSSNPSSGAAYSVALMVLQYFLPLAVLVFTYSRIAAVVWGKTHLGETPARANRVARSKKKTIKMMVTVVLVYTLCWLPFNTLMVIRGILDIDNWPHMLYVWAFFHWLAMSHTCYNPLILFWMNTKFRLGFYCVAHKLPCFRSLVDGFVSKLHESESLRVNTSNTPDGSCSPQVDTSLKDDNVFFKGHKTSQKNKSLPPYNYKRSSKAFGETNQ
ncbi:RYamide receptor-like [Macrobrachium nipponense]|uniref:RYamide receptor-like n=1 Tax=Macrobrachium nipponense TaxID=159736 RepID=UPI0030C85059